MSRDQVVLITGTTGSLGSWLARAALEDGLEVCAIARQAGGRSADERVRSSLAAAGAVDLCRLSVVEGDILEDDFGATGRLPQNIGRIIHCAACTDFSAHSAPISQRTNVEGVARILQFAARRQAPVVHLSTAYVAGCRAGLVREAELDVTQGFNNIYERTKCQGEELVHRWAERTRLPAIVLRPGIVAGAWETGRMCCFSAIYDFMHALDALKPSLRGQSLRLAGRADVTKNIIPVDYFARVAWRIIQLGVAGTYHLTHPQPIALDQLRCMFSELFEMRSITLVPEQDFARLCPTRAERICHRVMASYGPYLFNTEPIFDRCNTDAVLAGCDIEAPPLTCEYFARLLNYGRQVDWGRTAEASAPTPIVRPSIAEYFEVFLAQKVGRNLLPNLRKLTARFGIALREDPKSQWILDVHEGVLRAVSQNSMPTDCRYTVDEPTLLEIVTGRLAPQLAFFQRRVEIGGDVATGLKTAVILAQFFRQFPFTCARV